MSPRSFIDTAYKWEEYAIELGLKPSEFWDMEVNEFVRYSKHKSKAMKNEAQFKRQLNAELQATIANFVPMRDKKSKVFKPQDFMPQERKVLSADEFDNQLDKMVTVFGGKKGGHK